ncbi:MAG: NAD(P)-dependent alcohol dehydrogenase [Planctomycetaceae bacterium]|nr:NAD(P)-dependent alcohol dehydrogenase [Planctomycetaceae bacterium]
MPQSTFLSTLKTFYFIVAMITTVGIAVAQHNHAPSDHAPNNRVPAKGFAVHSQDDHFHPYEFTRHAVGDNDILIEILYAGICHSDLHAVWNEQQNFGIKSRYPMVPGHEIAGRVMNAGKNVTKFKIGDYAGVGCMVNACRQCNSCSAGKEQFCEKRTVFTYNSKDHYHENEITMGGYSNNIVVSENFAIKIPKNADIKKVAPLLCAGITTWSPIKFSKVKPGDKVGVAGFGGVGHMAVQYLVDLKTDVTVFDVNDEKRESAKRMGAKRYVNVRNPQELEGLNNTMDFIITTVPVDYDPMVYVRMLKMGGEMAIVGLPANTNINISKLPLGNANRKIYGSLIGGIQETQEMLDYSVANNIYPEVELIKAEAAEIDKAYKKVVAGEVPFRYVIDMSTLK